MNNPFNLPLSNNSKINKFNKGIIVLLIKRLKIDRF
jgi:hypothetical protein